MFMTIVISVSAAVLASCLDLGLCISLNVSHLSHHVHLGAEASSVHVLLVVHHLEAPGRLHGLSRGGVLPGGDGAEVTRASAEQAGHGAGGGAEARNEHPAEVTSDSQLRKIEDREHSLEGIIKY